MSQVLVVFKVVGVGGESRSFEADADGVLKGCVHVHVGVCLIFFLLGSSRGDHLEGTVGRCFGLVVFGWHACLVDGWMGEVVVCRIDLHVGGLTQVSL